MDKSLAAKVTGDSVATDRIPRFSDRTTWSGTTWK
jgi:hypothetical protein